MSHFLTLVITNEDINDLDSIESRVDELLAPYDENLEVDSYVDRTYEDIKDEYLRAIDEQKNKPDSFFAKQDEDISQMSLNEFTQWYYGAELEPEGTYSNYNPKSKWDWWSFGGRWNEEVRGQYRGDNDGGFNFGDEYRQLKNNVVYAKDIPSDLAPFAIITPDGEWHERGHMGWWAVVSDEDDNWEQRSKDILGQYSNCVAVGCDLHI